MTREEQITFAIRDLMKQEINTALDSYDTDGTCRRFAVNSILIWDYRESLPSYDNFILINATTEPNKEAGRTFFADLSVYCNIFYKYQPLKEGLSYRKGARYKAALARVIADHYNRIIGTRKFEADFLDATKVEALKNAQLLMTGVMTKTTINLTRNQP